MTEFTKEWISKQRKYVVDNGCLNDQLCIELLDEIERLQQRIAELEQDLSDQSQKRLENAHVSADRIIALEGIIRELEQERRWIPVSELSETIRALVYLGNDYTVIATYHKNTDKWKNDCGSIIENVIKYQPLPQPPQEGE